MLFRSAAGRIFDLLGAKYDHDSSGMFLWGKISPDNVFVNADDTSRCLGEQVSDKILYDAGVFITPGFIFGENGKNYIRISLCAKPEVLAESEKKIREIMK